MPYLLLFQKASPNCGSYYRSRRAHKSQAVVAPSLRLQVPPQAQLQASPPRTSRRVTSASPCPQTRLLAQQCQDWAAKTKLARRELLVLE